VTMQYYASVSEPGRDDDSENPSPWSAESSCADSEWEEGESDETVDASALDAFIARLGQDLSISEKKLDCFSAAVRSMGMEPAARVAKQALEAHAKSPEVGRTLGGWFFRLRKAEGPGAAGRDLVLEAEPASEARATPCGAATPAAGGVERLKPRSYQEELFRRSLAGGSAVVYLPTGAGKSLIAVLRIDERLRARPTTPVLVLAETVVMVAELIGTIRAQLAAPPGLIVRGYGGICTSLRPETFADLLAGQHVAVSTPQAMMGWLNRLGGTLAAFSLVVIDECHHASKDHPLNVLLGHWYLKLRTADRPPLLGLTASLPSDVDPARCRARCEDLLRNLGGCAIMAAAEPISISELARCTNPVATEEVVLDSDAVQVWLTCGG
jgi:hypothetical protein